MASAQQSADDRIGQMMADSRWFDLERELQDESLRDSVNPVIYGMARTLTNHYFNRPDSTCVSATNLLDNYQQVLGENTLSMAYLLGTGLSRAGEYDAAAGLMQSLADQLAAQGLDSTMTAGYEVIADLNRVYASLGEVNEPLHPAGEYRLPMLYVYDMHRASRNGADDGAHFIGFKGSINDVAGELVFDTGAGMNIISSRLADKYKLRYTDMYMPMAGIGTQLGRCAVADTLRLGNMSWHNVVFLVADISTGNAIADSLGEMLPPVIGLPIMLTMGEIRLDFENDEFVIPATTTSNPLGYSNMMRTDSEGLCVELDVDGERSLMHFDTGGYGTTMWGRWFDNHRDAIEAVGVPDSIRAAGVGGVSITHSYSVPSMRFTLGTADASIDKVQIDTGIDKRTGERVGAGDYADDSMSGVIGLDLLERFGTVIINLRDMFLVGIDPKQ